MSLEGGDGGDDLRTSDGSRWLPSRSLPLSSGKVYDMRNSLNTYRKQTHLQNIILSLNSLS